MYLITTLTFIRIPLRSPTKPDTRLQQPTSYRIIYLLG